MSAKKTRRTRLVFRSLPLVIGLVLAVFISGEKAYALTRSYQTKDTSIKIGMVVATVASGSTGGSSSQNVIVQKADQADANLAVGIVTNESTSELTYTAGQSGEIIVTNSGQVTAYVSDVNGTPKPGDLLAPSPLAGILMKATEGTNGIVAAMIGNFPSSTADQYTLKSGKKTEIVAAPVDMDIHPVNQPSPTNGLQAFISHLIGHDTTSVQAFVSLAIVALTIIVAGSIIYGASANYLTSVGRNPLAAQRLRRVLMEVLGLALGVVLAGVVGCWAVLWV